MKVKLQSIKSNGYKNEWTIQSYTILNKNEQVRGTLDNIKIKKFISPPIWATNFFWGYSSSY